MDVSRQHSFIKFYEEMKTDSYPSHCLFILYFYIQYVNRLLCNTNEKLYTNQLPYSHNLLHKNTTTPEWKRLMETRQTHKYAHN